MVKLLEPFRSKIQLHIRQDFLQKLWDRYVPGSSDSYDRISLIYLNSGRMEEPGPQNQIQVLIHLILKNLMTWVKLEQNPAVLSQSAVSYHIRYAVKYYLEQLKRRDYQIYQPLNSYVVRMEQADQEKKQYREWVRENQIIETMQKRYEVLKEKISEETSPVLQEQERRILERKLRMLEKYEEILRTGEQVQILEKPLPEHASALEGLLEKEDVPSDHPGSHIRKEISRELLEWSEVLLVHPESAAEEVRTDAAAEPQAGTEKVLRKEVLRRKIEISKSRVELQRLTEQINQCLKEGVPRLVYQEEKLEHTAVKSLLRHIRKLKEEQYQSFVRELAEVIQTRQETVVLSQPMVQQEVMVLSQPTVRQETMVLPQPVTRLQEWGRTLLLLSESENYQGTAEPASDWPEEIKESFSENMEIQMIHHRTEMSRNRTGLRRLIRQINEQEHEQGIHLVYQESQLRNTSVQELVKHVRELEENQYTAFVKELSEMVRIQRQNIASEKLQKVQLHLEQNRLQIQGWYSELISRIQIREERRLRNYKAELHNFERVCGVAAVSQQETADLYKTNRIQELLRAAEITENMPNSDPSLILAGERITPSSSGLPLQSSRVVEPPEGSSVMAESGLYEEEQSSQPLLPERRGYEEVPLHLSNAGPGKEDAVSSVSANIEGSKPVNTAGTVASGPLVQRTQAAEVSEGSSAMRESLTYREEATGSPRLSAPDVRESADVSGRVALESGLYEEEQSSSSLLPKHQGYEEVSLHLANAGPSKENAMDFVSSNAEGSKPVNTAGIVASGPLVQRTQAAEVSEGSSAMRESFTYREEASGSSRLSAPDVRENAGASGRIVSESGLYEEEETVPSLLPERQGYEEVPLHLANAGPDKEDAMSSVLTNAEEGKPVNTAGTVASRPLVQRTQAAELPEGSSAMRESFTYREEASGSSRLSAPDVRENAGASGRIASESGLYEEEETVSSLLPEYQGYEEVPLHLTNAGPGKEDAMDSVSSNAEGSKPVNTAGTVVSGPLVQRTQAAELPESSSAIRESFIYREEASGSSRLSAPDVRENAGASGRIASESGLYEEEETVPSLLPEYQGYEEVPLHLTNAGPGKEDNMSSVLTNAEEGKPVNTAGIVASGPLVQRIQAAELPEGSSATRESFTYREEASRSPRFSASDARGDAGTTGKTIAESGSYGEDEFLPPLLPERQGYEEIPLHLANAGTSKSDDVEPVSANLEGSKPADMVRYPGGNARIPALVNAEISERSLQPESRSYGENLRHVMSGEPLADRQRRQELRMREETQLMKSVQEQMNVRLKEVEQQLRQSGSRAQSVENIREIAEKVKKQLQEELHMEKLRRGMV